MGLAGFQAQVDEDLKQCQQESFSPSAFSMKWQVLTLLFSITVSPILAHANSVRSLSTEIDYSNWLARVFIDTLLCRTKGLFLTDCTSVAGVVPRGSWAHKNKVFSLHH